MAGERKRWGKNAQEEALIGKGDTSEPPLDLSELPEKKPTLHPLPDLPTEKPTIVPLPVTFRATFERITDISSTDQTFSARIYFYCSIPRGFQDKEGEVDAARFKDYYASRFKLLNLIEEAESSESDPCAETHDSKITLTWITTGIFTECMELQDFPCDTQQLNIYLEATRSITSDHPLHFSVAQGARCLVNIKRCSKINSMWQIAHDLTLRPMYSDKSESPTGKVFPIMLITATVHRRPSNFIWNVALPTFSFVCMALTSFCVEFQDVADRLSVSLTLVLAAAAYKFVIASMLPAIPYLTFLDKYVLMCSACLFGIVLENALVGKFGSEDQDKIIGMLVLSFFLVINLYFAVRFFLMTTRRNSGRVSGWFEHFSLAVPDKRASE